MRLRCHSLATCWIGRVKLRGQYHSPSAWSRFWRTRPALAILTSPKPITILPLLYAEDKHYSTAREYLQRAIAIWERVLPPDHLCWLDVWNASITIAVGERKFTEAISYIPRLLDLASSRLGPQNPDMVALLSNAGVAYTGAAKYEDAAAKFAQAINIADKQPVSIGEPYARMLTYYAQVLRKLHRKEDARAIEARAKEISKSLSAKR